MFGEVVRSALRLSREREDARSRFPETAEDATADSIRDGLRTERAVGAGALAALTEVRGRHA